MPRASALLGGDDDNRFIAGSSFLIVDDFSGMRTMLSGALRNCGANPRLIDLAGDSREALHLMGAKHYDVVICDYNLGEGQNGMQLLEEARYRQLVGPACCWLMISADKTLETVMETAEAQPDAYLLKPVTEAVLAARIRRIRRRKEAFREVNRAVLSGEYRQAISLCEERAAADRANALDLLRLKCDLMLRSGQWQKARGFYEQVLAAREIPWAQLGLARTYLAAGDPATACDLLEQLVSRSPNYLAAYDLLAETCDLLAMNEKAEHILERALSLSPRSHSRQRAMGELALALGKLERAEKAFRLAVQLAEHSVLKSPDSYLGLARVLGARGKAQEALEILKQMREAFDDERAMLKARNVECRLLEEAGERSRAQEAARELVQLLERCDASALGPAAMRDIADTLLRLGETDKALQLLRTEVMNAPEDDANLDAVRQILHRQGLSAQGDELVERSRQEAIEMMNSSALLSHAGDLEAAIGRMREALERMPRNVRMLLNTVHLLLSHMEQAGSDPQLVREARRHLQSARQLAPGEPRQAELLSRLEALGSTA